MTIPVKSGDPKGEANEYEFSVQKELGFNPGPKDYKPGGKMPDGVMLAPQGATEIALEVKYPSKGKDQIRDQVRDLPFAFPDDLRQETKYLENSKGGLLWVTNDQVLAAKYNEIFEKAALSGVRIVVIPSGEE